MHLRIGMKQGDKYVSEWTGDIAGEEEVGVRSGTFHHPFKVGPRSHIDREPPSTRKGNRIDGWFEKLTHQIAVQLCKTLCCAPGLFQHMLRRSSAEEGNRAEATRASRFERLQY